MIEQNAIPIEEVEPILWTDKQVAKYLHCSRSSIWKWTRDGILPPPINISTAVRWYRSDIIDFVTGLQQAQKQQENEGAKI